MLTHESRSGTRDLSQAWTPPLGTFPPEKSPKCWPSTSDLGPGGLDHGQLAGLKKLDSRSTLLGLKFVVRSSFLLLVGDLVLPRENWLENHAELGLVFTSKIRIYMIYEYLETRAMFDYQRVYECTSFTIAYRLTAYLQSCSSCHWIWLATWGTIC